MKQSHTAIEKEKNINVSRTIFRFLGNLNFPPPTLSFILFLIHVTKEHSLLKRFPAADNDHLFLASFFSNFAKEFERVSFTT
jgi:hypothetical protein